MKELPDYADLEADLALAFPDYALDLEAELAFGPAKCAAQEGIRRMELRIKGLTREAARASKGDDVERMRGVRRQLEDAHQQLVFFKAKLEARN
jgi:hypothetical protein